jgi:hypothetical protein
MEITLDAQAFPPNHRYDLMQPLLQGRVDLDGLTIRPSPSMQSAGFFDNPRFQSGDFGLLDINVGDVLPAIEAGWDMVCLPVFNKRKPLTTTRVAPTAVSTRRRTSRARRWRPSATPARSPPTRAECCSASTASI